MFLFFILIILFYFKNTSLLLSLLILEISSFIIIYGISFEYNSVLVSDCLFIILFSIFVIEGVIGLSGLILLVRFSGSDYIKNFCF
jgi:hypothetical protein